MSEKQLRLAARLKVPEQVPEFGDKLLMMLMADRADDDGYLPGGEEVMDALVAEVNALHARLRGDELVRPDVDNARISRVVKALRGAEDEQ